MKNIIFICADQLAAARLGCYGSGVDSTPRLDELARRGIRYDRFYAAHPVCAPNRATFLTGRSREIHGIIHNNYVLQTDMPTYAHLMQRRGYRTGGFGKFHQSPMCLDTPEDESHLGFDESCVTEDPKWGAWLDWVKEERPQDYPLALSVSWGYGRRNISEKTVALRKQMIQEKLEPMQKNSEWEKMYPSPLPAELHDTVYLTDRSLAFMKNHREHHDSQPFFCHISYVDPHDPYDPPEPYASLYNPDDMGDPIPAEWLDDPGAVAFMERLETIQNFKSIYDKPEAVRQLRALYHGSMKLMDDQIGRIIDWLKETGLEDETHVIFTSDHGDQLGDHGQITKGIIHYDTGIRCPLILAGPGIAPRIDRELRSSLDIYPTLCDLAEIEESARPPVEGKTLLAEGWQEICVSIEDAYSVITQDGWRLTRLSDTNWGQMFNLIDDPREQMNLYDNTIPYGKIKIELLEKLHGVSTRPARIPQYRNMPQFENLKWSLGGFGSSQLVNPRPLYPKPNKKEAT